MAYDVAHSELKYDGAVVKVRVDAVTQPDGSLTEREVPSMLAPWRWWPWTITSGCC